jgi:uncharacterized protein (DUF1778 family)
MKQPINFRINENTNLLLEALANRLNTTRTNIIEISIKSFAKKTLKEKHKLSKYIGSIPAKVMDELLETIKGSRINKKLPVSL